MKYKIMEWKELIQKINNYNNNSTIYFNKDNINIELLKQLGNTPEESYKNIVSIILKEYITRTYIPKFARWEDNPIKLIIETKIMGELNNYVESILDSLDNNYDKILDIIKNSVNENKISTIPSSRHFINKLS